LYLLHKRFASLLLLRVRGHHSLFLVDATARS
jgi:hypothetical protein